MEGTENLVWLAAKCRAVLLLPGAADARGDGGTVRAGSWVPEEDANLLGDLRTQSVLDS